MAFINTLWFALLPMGLVIYLLQKNRIESVELETREDRNTVYPPTLLLSSVYLFFAWYQGALSFKWNLGVIVVLLLCWMVNKYWFKPSVHMAGTGGLFALSVFLWLEFHNSILIFIAIIILVLTYWARSALKAHTTVELLVGTLLGLIPIFVFLLL